MSDDIRDQLRKDHDAVLAELEALRAETDASRAFARLAAVRRTWVIHALAEETVVYRALEGPEAANDSRTGADQRFVEHELVEGLFDKLSRGRPGTLEWNARLTVARDLVVRHIEIEQDETFRALAERLDAGALAQLAQSFALVREKLTLLEEAKAA